MKTVNIKGKEYVTVNERLKYFRENYEGWRLLSKIEHLEDGMVVIRAVIANPDGERVASGIAYEKAGSSFINKTSYVENCETSAWGRALANFGIGIDASVASAQEVRNAVDQQRILDKKEPIINSIKLMASKDSSLIDTIKTYTAGKKLIDLAIDDLFNLEAELAINKEE